MDKGKRLFFITPIGNNESEIRKRTDGIIENILKIAFPDFDVKCSHMLPGSMINNEILEHIDEDELVVADLTGLNPNVMYELAFRHSVEKPVVLIALRDTKIPFDISHDRVIFYEDSFSGASNLIDGIKGTAKAALEAKTIENPISIYRSVRKKNARKNFEKIFVDKKSQTLPKRKLSKKEAFLAKVSVEGNEAAIKGELDDDDWAELKKINTYCPDVENIHFCNVARIKNGAFSDPENRWLKKISAPKALRIGELAFCFCSEVGHFDLQNVESVGYCAFGYCESMESPSLPNVTHIDKEAFSGCKKLENISLPVLGNIPDELFDGCWSLRKVDFPKVKSIDMHSFPSQSLLEELRFGCEEHIDTHPLAFEFAGTKKITLYLRGANLESVENGNKWGGCIWKSIQEYKPL
ncbi:MAG: leucine-rich repeat domain-containing protein [Prevotellaceae bacterium]|jgi:hypothetical protein|nr:leucine-rich repeat domain-containing protein [Prevotellaceae bacterium]